MMRAAFLFLLLLATSALAADYPGAPASVVAAYIESDGEGKALDSDTAPQVLRYTIWQDAPGWDSFVVIKSYDIGEVGYSKDRDKASVQITYQILGQLSGLAYVDKTAKEEVYFDVVKIKGRWKITSPQPAPHLTAAGAVAFLKANDAGNDPSGKAALKKLQALE